jgi:hypothetical protein
VKFSPSEVLQAAEVTGFKVEMVEKALHLDEERSLICPYFGRPN